VKNEKQKAMKSEAGISVRKVKLGDICFIIGGNPSPKEKEFSEDGIPFVKMKDLGKYHHTTSLSLTENKVSPYLIKTKKLKVIKKGSIVIPRSGSVGLNHRGILKQDSVIVSHICALEIKDSKNVHNVFLYYYLTTIDMVRITKQTTGLDAITFEDLATLEIPLPPLATQKRIAEILDAADTLRRKDQELLKKYDELAQAIFIDMFGDPVKNEKGWEVKKLGAVSDVRDGTHDSPKYTSFGYPLVTSKNLKNGSIDLSEVNHINESDFIEINRRSKVDIGDILMPMIGTIGNPVYVDFEPYFAIKNVCLIKKSSILNPHFLKSLLSSSLMKVLIEKQSKGGTQKFLSLGDIRSIEIPIPPIELQEEFERKQLKIFEINKKTRKEMGSSELFASLLQKAFKVELVG
jgi:type I restriction enzyme S subunit